MEGGTAADLHEAKEGGSQHKPRAAAINCGRRSSVTHTARIAVTAGLQRARDGLVAASIRVKGAAKRGEAPSSLVEAWRAVASSELPDAAALDALCCFTLTRWGRQTLGDKVAQLEAWSAVYLEHGAAFALPRPLLRAMAKSMWADGGSATPLELSTAALRAAPFLKTPAADLARSILDAVVHWSAELVAAQGTNAVSELTVVLGLAPYASRTDATQRELHMLRLAASQAKTPEQVLEEAIYQRVSWMKTHLRCDSVTARRRVAASLARDTMEHGGDMRSTFIKAFGHAPEAGIAEEEEEGTAREGARRAALPHTEAAPTRGMLLSSGSAAPLTRCAWRRSQQRSGRLHRSGRQLCGQRRYRQRQRSRRQRLLKQRVRRHGVLVLCALRWLLRSSLHAILRRRLGPCTP